MESLIAGLEIFFTVLLICAAIMIAWIAIVVLLRLFKGQFLTNKESKETAWFKRR